jgi:hypothetical protein
VRNALEFVRTYDWAANSSRYLELIRSLLSVSPEISSRQCAFEQQAGPGTPVRTSKRESVH